MAAVCAVVFAGFCFSGNPIAFDGVDAGMGYRVHAESSGYVAESRGADAVRPLDWRGSHRACLDRLCLRYWKHCDTNAQQMRCEYTFGDDAGTGIDHRAITVSVADEKALATAESRIGVQMGGEDRVLTLWLAAMTVRSSTAEPPPCPDDALPNVCRIAR